MQPVVIDTDPGVDDLFAILSALGSERLRVEAITTVGGNVQLAQVTRNALGILAMAGRADVPVYSGAEGPLLQTAREVHGSDGLHGLQLPEPQAEARSDAAGYLIAAARAVPGLRLACLGPLTNLALALRRDPELPRYLGDVVLMGGAFGTFNHGGLGSAGNVAAQAEFNIWADAQAAAEVAASALSLTFVPLDASHQTLMTEPRLDEIGQLPVWGPALRETLRAYGQWTRHRTGAPGGPLHDPNVLAYLEAPELYETVEGTVTIGPERGRTVLGAGTRHRVAVRVDAEGFFALVCANLRRVFAR